MGNVNIQGSGNVVFADKANVALVNGVVLKVTENEDGLDISLTLPEGQHNAWHQSHDGGFEMVTRDVALPSKGSRVEVNGRVHKVKDRVFDDNRHCHIIDEDTGEKVLWA